MIAYFMRETLASQARSVSYSKRRENATSQTVTGVHGVTRGRMLWHDSGTLSELVPKFFLLVAALLCFLFLAPALSAQQTTHRFWDKTTIILHSANAAAQTADAISTQRFLRLGYEETNPLARPLVTNGWKGQVAASYGVGVGGTLLGSYLAHRKGWHKFERLIPVLVAVPTGIVAWHNFRLEWRIR